MEQEVPPIIIPSNSQPLVIGNVTFRSAYDHHETEQDLKDAYREFGETEEIRKDCLRKLKEKLLSDGGMIYRTDDRYLLRYLRYRKFNCDEAYKCIRKFYTFRKMHPEMFSLPSNLESLLNTAVFRWLPYRNTEGNLIFLTKMGNWNFEERPIYEILHIVTCITDIASSYSGSQIHGHVHIWDQADMTLRNHSYFSNPRILRLFFTLLQDSYPNRVKRVIILNTNLVFLTIYKVFRCFMKKKLKDRIVLLGSDMTELHKYVDPVLLPPEYGGSLQESDKTTQLILNNLSYIKFDRSFGSAYHHRDNIH